MSKWRRRAVLLTMVLATALPLAANAQVAGRPNMADNDVLDQPMVLAERLGRAARSADEGPDWQQGRWPGPGNTGVLPGTALTPSEDVLVDVDGTILRNLDVKGCLIIDADDVKVLNSRIRCGGGPGTPWPVRILAGHRGVLLQDVEVDGAGKASVAICCSNYTLLRGNVHNSVDGPRVGSNVKILDSFVHDLARVPKSHNDTLQTIGGTSIVIKGNNLQAYRTDTRDPMNGALQTGRLTSRLDDVLVVGNLFNGGTYTIRGGSGKRDRGMIGRYVFRHNEFGRDSKFGYTNDVGRPVDFDRTNVLADSRIPVLEATRHAELQVTSRRQGDVVTTAGVVLDEEGDPMPSVDVVLLHRWARAGVATDVARTRTDGRGRFTFERRTGPVYVSARVGLLQSDVPRRRT